MKKNDRVTETSGSSSTPLPLPLPGTDLMGVSLSENPGIPTGMLLLLLPSVESNAWAQKLWNWRAQVQILPLA